MLNPNLLRYDPNGAIYCTNGPGLMTDFNGGTPMDSPTQQLCVGPTATFFNSGLGYGADGSLAVDFVAAAVYYIAGLPISVDGKLCCDNTPGVAVTTTAGGVPLTAAGRVPINIGGTPILDGFDDGFDNGFGA